MPAKGYKKGLSDQRAPLPVLARTRITATLKSKLDQDAILRRVTCSKLMRTILEQHYLGKPVPRIKSSGASYAVARELNRIGVNLNQLAHLANATRQFPPQRLQQLLERIEATIGRL